MLSINLVNARSAPSGCVPAPLFENRVLASIAVTRLTLAWEMKI